jgi:hypothetical protein
MNSYVYMLIDPRNNLPFYIGKGARGRCYFHMWEARNSAKQSPKLNKIRKIERLGLSVRVCKVEQNVTDEMAKDLECLLIAEARDIGIELTNLTDGGDGTLGLKRTPEQIAKSRHTWTDEQKQKISESLKGERNPHYGKPCDESRRQAIIKGTTGVKKSTTKNMKKPKRKEQCPHCKIMASGGNLARWHMDNCKSKE